MAYSKQIAAAINKFLTDDDWRYTFNEEEGTFRFTITLKCKLQNMDYLVRVREDSYAVFGISPMGASDCLSPMAEFITRANYGLKNGNFEMDYSDGELRYKTYVNCDGAMPSKEVIEDSIYIPALMMDRYGSGIVAVMFGVKTPEDAVTECEK